LVSVGFVLEKWQTKVLFPVSLRVAGRRNNKIINNIKTMDPIADMLTSIRNAQGVLKETTQVPFSNLKFEIAKILKKEGFIEGVSKKGRKTKKLIEIKLKYDDKEPVISGLRKISKPGQRIYLSAKDIRPVKNGYGIAILSTSKGLMTDKQARKNKVGGEMLCEIW
jgi:small subunit ribosomal protein S8